MPSTPLCHRAVVVTTLVVLLCACSKPPVPPNVLLIVADDLGYNDIAIDNGSTDITTPSMDALAREGVRFTQHYADAVCSPARAALLAGQYPARLGFEPNGRGISPELTTLAEALRDHGYHTMHIGKWHIGHTLREAWPDRQGFEHWFGFLNQWFLSGDQENGQLTLGADRHENPWLMRDGDAGARYEGYLDDILTGEAITRIRELGQSGKPWFINLWYYLPHAPITPSPAFASRYPDTGEGRYRAMLEHLDTNVGRVLKALDDTQQDRSTIVVLVSDNGAATAKADSNAPFYGNKTTFFEGGVRTPLLIRWPNGEQAGTVDTRVVAIYDIYPTLLARLGIPVPAGLDGRNLAEPETAPRDLFWESFVKQHYSYSVLHEGRWRLYRLWPFTNWEAPARLYDIATTPGAPVDVSEANHALRDELDRRRREWHRDVHTPALHYDRGDRSGGTLSGLDFLRTPGFGGFSFALAFDGSYAGRLAEQQDVWSMHVGEGGAIAARFGPHHVGGRLTPAPCHTALVSAWFGRRISTLPGARDLLHLALYLDGELVDTLDADTHIDDSHYHAPTLLGPARSRDGTPGVGEPLLLTAPVEGSDVWQAPALHAELCAKLEAGAVNPGGR